MWKAVMLVSSMCISYSILAAGHQSHLQELQKEFPHGLLTDDYGILNRRDLKINACTARPDPFTDPPINQAYSYWQCFEVKNTNMVCEGGKYDAYEKAQMSMLVISGARGVESHEFISRRPIPLESCRLYQKDWQRFTKNMKYICVSALSPSKELKRKKAVWVWIFDRYKTKIGCDSYFEGACTSVSACEASNEFPFSHGRLKDIAAQNPESSLASKVSNSSSVAGSFDFKLASISSID